MEQNRLYIFNDIKAASYTFCAAWSSDGDVKTAVIIGASLEMIYMGLVPAGDNIQVMKD